MEYVELVGGLILLLIAGDALVSGAGSLAIRYKVPPLLIGLTIVAFGTSAPELFVSIEAAFEGSPGIAIGNVVGSNIANILLVLGLPAIFFPMIAEGKDIKRNMWVVIGASILFSALVMTGEFRLWHGIILFSGILAFLYFESRGAKNAKKNGEFDYSEIEDELDASPKSGLKIAALIAFGVIGLPMGAEFLVDGASEIASDFGVSDAIIGLTVVALGTSLPELAAVFSSVRKNESELAIGNILGSNLFNMLAVMGLTSIIHPVEIDRIIIEQDIWIMLFVTALLAIAIFAFKRINKVIGVLFTALYLSYVLFALV